MIKKIGPAAACDYEQSASCWLWLLKRFRCLKFLWSLWIPYFKWRYQRYSDWYDKQPKYD